MVVLSPHFFQKQWPFSELNGLFALEKEENSILPVWHGVTKSDVTNYSPILADRFGANTSDGINAVATAVAKVIQKDGATAYLAQLIDAGPSPESLCSFLTVHPHILVKCIGQRGMFYDFASDQISVVSSSPTPFHLTTRTWTATPEWYDWRCSLFLPSRPCNDNDVDTIISTMEQCEMVIEEANAAPNDTAHQLTGIKRQEEEGWYNDNFRGAVFIGRRGDLPEKLKEAVRDKKRNSRLIEVFSYDRLLEMSASLQ